MKKQSTFDPDTPLPPHGSVPELGNRRPCLVCHTATLIATLSQYGGRCFGCYEAYCREPTTPLGAQIRRPMQHLDTSENRSES